MATLDTSDLLRLSSGAMRGHPTQLVIARLWWWSGPRTTDSL